jgi:hypothetical protein
LRASKDGHSPRRIRCFNLSPSRSIESAPRQLRSRPNSFAPPISQARFAPDGQITQNLSSPFEKNISLPPSGKSALPARPSFPGKRGVSRSSRTRERMRWTRQRRRAQVIAGRVSRERYRRAGRTTPKRTAKPCGPGTRCWCQTAGGEIDPTGFDSAIKPAATVTRRIRRRGEHDISRQTIARGMPECFR